MQGRSYRRKQKMIKNLPFLWNPKLGDLIVHRGDNKVYQILEVISTPYGFTNFIAISGEELKNLSTLNCELVEHMLGFNYNINMSETCQKETT